MAEGEEEDSASKSLTLYTNSGLKSGPKNFWFELHEGVEVDMGVLASEPRPSVEEEIFLLRFLQIKMKFSRNFLHSGMFPEVLFRCENVGRQRDFVNF